MTIGVLKEPHFETRVSLLPEHITALRKQQIDVFIEFGAGEKSAANDEAYQAAGAVVAERNVVIQSAELILAIHQPDAAAMGMMRGKSLLGYFLPLYHVSLMQSWAQTGVTVFSIDMLPRTTRAQSMDVLSSQANIAGYKAVLLAANVYPRYFPMFMTAAGSIAPAKVLILGAGVAGLQAIATARRLGAVVEVFDTRPAVKEEVMSLGAKFIEVGGAADASAAGGYAVEQSEDFMRRQKDKIAESVAKADIVITTAQIPGKKAPVLISAEMIATMRNGSVIIDLAAATGGNTAKTVNNETVIVNGVTIIGQSALSATMPSDASKLYGKNMLNFIQLITTKEGVLQFNFEDDLVKGCCVCNNGAIVHERLLTL